MPEQSSFNLYRWCLFAIASLLFFLNTAGSFGSLGVALPYMIKDLGWSQSQAGFGFSLLALATGLAAPLPALLLRKFGLKLTYFFGAVLLIAGVVLMATTQGLTQYYCAAVSLGIGISLCSSVPGVYFVNNWLPDKQSFAIGALFMVGGLGGVLGPQLVTKTVEISGSWQAHWWVMAGLLVCFAVLALLFLKDKPKKLPAKIEASLAKQQQNHQRVHRSEVAWTFPEAVRTPQFYIITIALTLMLLNAVTMNTWAYSHMTSLGVLSATAAAVLSMQAVVNSVSRVIGGSLASFIDPKWLLVSALLADMIGMLALSVGDNFISLMIFAIADGYGFGMCFFASTMVMVNYFGSKASPELLSAMNFITTLAMVGPFVAGLVSDDLGGFVWVFRGCAVLLLVFVLVLIMMRPPQHKSAII